MKKFLTLCLLLILTILFISAQSNISKRIKLDKSSVVYVAPGESVFHLHTCKKLGRARTGMTLSSALAKGYTPCPDCIPMKKSNIEHKVILEEKLDILSTENLLESKSISICGISISDSVEEALNKLDKTVDDIRSNKDASLFFIDIATGITIKTKDKEKIDSIFLRYDGKENFRDKTREIFNIISHSGLYEHLVANFGKPDYILDNTDLSFLKKFEVYYLKGFIFSWMSIDKKTMVSIELTSRENTQKQAKENGAKTIEEVKKIETGDIPISKTGFRQTLWGMNKGQVKKREAGKVYKEEKMTGAMAGLDILVYQENIAGLDCLIAYYFAENKLTRARYLFSSEHSNKNLFIQDYKNVQTQLSEKYGKPYRDDVIWSNDLYKDDLSEYGTAVSLGHLQYATEWKQPETYIQLTLHGDNFEISHWVEYTSNAFHEFEKLVMKKAKKDIW